MFLANHSFFLNSFVLLSVLLFFNICELNVLLLIFLVFVSRDSLVNLVTRLRPGRSILRIPAGIRDLFLLHKHTDQPWGLSRNSLYFFIFPRKWGAQIVVLWLWHRVVGYRLHGVTIQNGRPENIYKLAGGKWCVFWLWCVGRCRWRRLHGLPRQ